jgi:hypothetical protein
MRGDDPLGDLGDLADGSVGEVERCLLVLLESRS